MGAIDINAQFVTVKIDGDHDTTKPMPLVLKRAAEGQEPNLWGTGDGRRVFATEEWALKSMEMETQEYKDRQRARIDAGRLVRAEVVDNYDGWLTTTGDEDDYAQDVAELLEKHGDRLAWAGVDDADIPSQLPAWAFCCTEDGFDFDMEAQLDCYLQDNHHESARDWLVNERRLWKFWNAWAAKQNLKSYMIDYKHIVVIDRERYETELAAARLVLEAL